MKINNKDLIVGQIVWICDYRYNDIFKKPIRSIKPTRVITVDNDDLPESKTVYYSETHFRPLNDKGKQSSKIICPCDNTGYRMHSGGCVNIFDNENECVECFNSQCKIILKEIEIGKEDSINRFNKMLEETKNKMM